MKQAKTRLWTTNLPRGKPIFYQNWETTWCILANCSLMTDCNGFKMELQNKEPHQLNPKHLLCNPPRGPRLRCCLVGQRQGYSSIVCRLLQTATCYYSLPWLSLFTMFTEIVMCTWPVYHVMALFWYFWAIFPKTVTEGQKKKKITLTIEPSDQSIWFFHHRSSNFMDQMYVELQAVWNPFQIWPIMQFLKS